MPIRARLPFFKAILREENEAEHRAFGRPQQLALHGRTLSYDELS